MKYICKLINFVQQLENWIPVKGSVWVMDSKTLKELNTIFFPSSLWDSTAILVPLLSPVSHFLPDSSYRTPEFALVDDDSCENF